MLNMFPWLKTASQVAKKNQVILDAGHGGYDLGLKANDKYNEGYKGILEKNINLEIANRVAWFCARHEVRYYMTRWGDRFISLSERVKQANQAGGSILISFHCNFALEPSWKGLETYYYYGSKKGKGYAEKCQKLLLELKYTKDRGAKFGTFYVIKETKMPAILTEFGFLSNPEDATYLNNENNQSLIASKVWQLIKEICI